MSEWISVNDRLPIKTHNLGGTWFSDEVLTVDSNGLMRIDYVVYPHGIYGHSTNPEFGKVGYGNDEPKVTHWMPLPEPPK